MNKLILFFIIIIFFFILIYPIYAPYQIESEKTILIQKGEGLFDIANHLQKEGVIKNKFHFIFYTLISGSRNKLKAGEYRFDSRLSMNKVVSILVLGTKIKEIKITIPEGFNIIQIEDIFKERGFNISLKNKKIKDFKKDFSFLSDAPSDSLLEGYLFPDTYIFSINETENSIIRKFLINFGNKLTDDLKNEIKKQNKTIFDIIIIASLIEKEVKDENDRYIVSGILWKRLKNNIPLQVDATISYITGKKTTKINLEELKINSPFNTYLYKGLPKGPISNPGILSIKAAIFPKETDYWFYLTTPEDKVIYSKTFEEHKKAKSTYLK